MSQTPKNIVVTGGNNGIGYQTVKALYQQGHNVIFGSRNQTKNQEVVKNITQKQGGTLISFPLDLTVIKSIDNFANSVLTKFNKIDILINNAGLIMNQLKVVQETGYEYTLTANHFGHFYLTYLLWNTLLKSPEARVINISSMMHYNASKDYLQNLDGSKSSFSANNLYSNSKLFNVLFTQGLNQLIQKNNIKNVKTACLHPGAVSTGFGQDNSMIKFFKCFCCCIFVEQQKGARTSLYLSRLPFSEIKSGEYYNDDTKLKEMDQRGRKVQDVQKLWAISQKTYGIKFQ